MSVEFISLGRVIKMKSRIQGINRQVVKALREPGSCLHPDAPNNCSGNTIKAHTVPHKFLKMLANESAHMYHMSATPSSPVDRFNVQTLSIRNASTFCGFCSYHDNKLFIPIENDTLSLTRRHAFLLAYRSMSKAIYNNQQMEKLRQSNVIANDRGLEMAGHIWHDPATFLPPPDVEDTFAKMQTAIRVNNFNQTRFYATVFDCVPDILCSTAIIVYADLNGAPLPSQPSLITVSLLPYMGSKGVAIFAWFHNSKANERFVTSLANLTDHCVPDTLARFLFHHAKDIFFRTTWWDSLSTEIQTELSKRFLHSFRPNDLHDWIDRAKTENNYVGWKVIGRKNNLRL